MAEVIGIIASITTLLTLAKAIATQVRSLRRSLGSSPSVTSLSDEIDGTATVLQELKLLSLQTESDTFLNVWQQSNFGSVIEKTTRHLSSLQAALERDGFGGQDRSSRNILGRVRWLFHEKEILKHVEIVQRQKLTLLLGLSSFIMRWDVQQHEYVKTNFVVLKETNVSTTELRLSIHRAHDILREILENQNQLRDHQSFLHSMVVQRIGHHLRDESSRFSPAYESFATSREEHSASGDPAGKLFKVCRARNVMGILEITYGSAAYFHSSSLSPPTGLGVRCNYIPPAWFARMMISISFALKILPRLGLQFGLHYVSEVPWEADILKFAQVGDLDALKDLLRTGRASATDRDLRGTTALHLAAYRRDVPMCRLLLSEGADSSAIMTYSNVPEMNVTPLRYLTLSASFHTIPHQQQQEIIYVLGTATLPKIELTEKSPVQLLFAASDVECEAGPLIEGDLQKLDVGRCDNCGVTYLMMACEFGCIKAVKALIRAGADVNIADIWGNTALHHASWSGYEDCLEELLTAGADCLAKNCISLGLQTPEDMAIWRGNALFWNIASERARKRTSEIQEKQQGNDVENLEEEESTEGLVDLYADRTKEGAATRESAYKTEAAYMLKKGMFSITLLLPIFLLFSLAFGRTQP